MVESSAVQSGSHPQSEGIKIDANIEVVLVGSKQSLKCMKCYTPPDTKVTMGVGCSFFPDHNDDKLIWQSRQGVGEGGYILWHCRHVVRVVVDTAT